MLEKMAKQILAEFNERGFDGFILDYKASDPLTRCNIINYAVAEKRASKQQLESHHQTATYKQILPLLIQLPAL